MLDHAGPSRRRMTGVSVASSSDGESSAFWSDTSSTSPPSFSSSPATSATSVFSSSACSSSRRSSFSSDFITRRPRANTGISVTLDTLTEVTSAVSEDYREPGQFDGLVQFDDPAPQRGSPPHSTDRDVQEAEPADPRSIISDRCATGAENGLFISDIQEGAEEEPSGSRPASRAGLSRLLEKSRNRAASLSRLSLTGRPKLERREAATHSEQRDDSPVPSRLLRNKKLRKLQGRFARSAPTSPFLTPTPSTDRVNLFQSRPNSFVHTFTGRRPESSSAAHLPLFSPPCGAYTSPLSSCNASYYLPATDSIHITIGTDEPEPEEVYEEAFPKDLFDSILPREVRIKIFYMVVQTFVDEQAAQVDRGLWTARRAGQERWIGEAGGLRALVGLSQVCREWRELAFDGQLWQNIRIARQIGNASFSPEGLVRLAGVAGSFLRKLDLRGFANLQSEDLDAITESCSAYAGITSLVDVDLTGCRAVSTKSLHYFLAHSPQVASLRLRGLPAVVSSTCDVILAAAVDRLVLLDISLCRNLLAAALLDLNQRCMTHLYAAKVSSMDTPTVAGLPGAFPHLETLDIGYCRTVTDEAFRSWGNSFEDQKLPLKHLRLSGCARLTDQMCLSLVGKVPYLESLELASIGANLRDAGLVKLLEGCLHISHIDLEDAISLTDRTIAALTPGKQRTRYAPPVSAPLEHLVLTNVPEITEPALVRLIKACPSLRVIECANSVTASDAFVKSYLQHVRRNKIEGAEISVIDCRGVGRQAFRSLEHSNAYRPRRGVRDYANRHFEYLDPPREAGPKAIAECDDRRIVVKSFWSWQQLDDTESAARAARTARLAIEGGAATPKSGSSPAFLRHARRASSFAFRSVAEEPAADGGRRSPGSSCIIC